MSQIIIEEQYKIIKDITQSHSSKICQGISLKNGKSFAIKLQNSEKSNSILREATILRNIQQRYPIIVDYGLPFCFTAGVQNKNNYSLLDLLSNNIQFLLKKCKGIFTIKTFLMLADQMLKRIQFLHRQEYIHRRISLKKFIMGRDKNTKRLYLCGLGQGKRYIKNGIHIEYKQGKQIKGQLNYISINVHLGLQESRRDDLQSLMYCWVKILYGKLPWQDQKNHQKILAKKIQNSGSIIFSSFPKQLQQIYDYCRKLSFDEYPNYEYLRNLIQDLFHVFNLEYDYDFDWEQKQFEENKLEHK